MAAGVRRCQDDDRHAGPLTHHCDYHEDRQHELRVQEPFLRPTPKQIARRHAGASAAARPGLLRTPPAAGAPPVGLPHLRRASSGRFPSSFRCDSHLRFSRPRGSLLTRKGSRWNDLTLWFRIVLHTLGQNDHAMARRFLPGCTVGAAWAWGTIASESPRADAFFTPYRISGSRTWPLRCNHRKDRAAGDRPAADSPTQQTNANETAAYRVFQLGQIER